MNLISKLICWSVTRHMHTHNITLVLGETKYLLTYLNTFFKVALGTLYCRIYN